MQWHHMVVTGALAVSLAGCSESLSSPQSVVAERARLVSHTMLLKDDVARAGRMTPELQAELEVLKQEILEWQRRTGRSDLGFTTSRPARDMTSGLIVRGPSPAPCTVPCPPVKVTTGSICFLVDSGCGGNDRGKTQTCVYTCVWT